jgi:hypothetical protein
MKSFAREETQVRQYSEHYTRMAAVNNCGISTAAGKITKEAALKGRRHNKWYHRWYRLLLARTTANIIHFKEK